MPRPARRRATATQGAPPAARGNTRILCGQGDAPSSVLTTAPGAPFLRPTILKTAYGDIPHQCDDGSHTKDYAASAAAGMLISTLRPGLAFTADQLPWC